MVVLDSWALLAYLKDEPPAERIEAAWLGEGASICSVNLGEVLYIHMRAGGEDPATAEIETVRKRLDVVDSDWPLVAQAARIKARGGLSYADAFCIATGKRLEAAIWTGDPEIVKQAGEHSCEVINLAASP